MTGEDATGEGMTGDSAAGGHRPDADAGGDAGDDAGTAGTGGGAGDRSPIVVMGVSASGKSTVGVRVAARLGLAFVDADDLHPASNIAKMAAGAPLDDGDRWPWLDAVAARLAQGRVVVACSALKRAYRDRLRASAPTTVFVQLSGSAQLLAQRATSRRGHFMPPSLLRSQLDALEPLAHDEAGFVVDITPPVDAVVDSVAARLE